MSKKKIIFASILLLISAQLSGVASSRISQDETEAPYFYHKSRDNLAGAMAEALKGALRAEDQFRGEMWLFRMAELVRFPDQAATVLDNLGRLTTQNGLFRNDRVLRARTSQMTLNLLLRLGRIDEAGKLRNSLGFIRYFRIIGPLEGSDLRDFAREHSLEKESDFSSEHEGKSGKVRWFEATADPEGKIDFHDLFETIRGSIFYLKAFIDIQREGEYFLSLGKNGPCTVWVGGTKVFSSHGEHGFAVDQYQISLRLGRGRYPVLIKTAGTEEGCMFAVRLTDVRGEAVPPGIKISTPGEAGVKSFHSGYFGSLEGYFGKENADEKDSFMAGYLVSILGLNSSEKREALKFFNRAKEHRELAPMAFYYAALTEGNPGDMEKDLLKAVELKKDFVEALVSLGGRKIDLNLADEAEPLIREALNISPQSPSALMMQGEYYISRGWYREAEKTAGELLAGKNPSAGEYTLGKIKKLRGEYEAASRHYAKLYGMDRLGRDHLESLLECLDKAGRFHDAAKAVEGALNFFPNSVRLRLKLASFIGKAHGVSASIPMLSAAHALSPGNAATLFDLGEAYHRMDRKEAARYYLGLARTGDPNNFSLNRYYSFLYDKIHEKESYRCADDPLDLAARAVAYLNEPAVVLLDETVYRLHTDGSHEKTVRAVYLINQASEINEFSRYSIVINPSTDRLEGVRCVVINGSERVATSETHSRSLSDPESRLYYDLTAHVLTAPGLRPGSIMSVEYVVKSRKESEYGGYFGEGVTTGGKYRVLKSNIVLRAPLVKNVYCKLRNIATNKLLEKRDGGEKIFHVALEDIPPFPEENNMPHYSEIVPSVIFTTHGDWDSLYRWYYSLLRNRIIAGPVMMRELNTIINPDDSPMERVRKIFYHVTGRVRYVGFELGIGGIQPRPADLTYSSGMGDCKDITLVLVALLRAAGIDARIALLRTNDRGEPDMSVPWMGVFNHAICYVNIGGGFFLDGTAEYSGYREIPEFDRNVPALVMDENGYRIIEVSSSHFADNLLAIHNEVVINKDGGAEVRRRFLKQGGMYAPSGRYGIQDENEHLNNISKFWNGAYPGSSVTDVRIIESDPENPVEYDYTVRVPSLGQTQSDVISFKSLMIPTGVYGSYGISRKREHPLVLGGKFETIETLRYRIPAGFKAYRVPESGVFRAGKFTAEVRCEIKENGNVIEVTHGVSYKKTRVSVAEYPGFREMLKFINAKENELIILVKDEAGGDKR